MLGNGAIGILKEDCNKWERRAPLAPLHCGRLLRSGAVEAIVVEPCSKRIFRDGEYEDAGCTISHDLSRCGLILGVKQPQLGSLIENRAYGFFSHTHKAQPQNMPLLDEVLLKKVLLYDYELIAGEDGKRLVAFGEYAGRAGMIDFLRGLGERLLSLGYSTPFVSLGSSYMYTSLSAAKAAILSVGDIISSSGLPPEICPLVFVFTASGNVSRGAQEILKLLPHDYVDASDLKDFTARKQSNHKVFASVVTPEHMVVPNDSNKSFNKAEYYAHPEEYHSVFHENIAPYASVIVNCMYWEHRYPALLTNDQMQEMFSSPAQHPRLLGIADITCDIGGSIECLTMTTAIEHPFFRYDPIARTHHRDLDGEGILFLAVDILPTEFAKEATTHFGNVLYPLLSSMARSRSHKEALLPLRRACIADGGRLNPLYDYIERIRQSETRPVNHEQLGDTPFKTMVPLSGHLFDKFLINEALDVVEKAGGKFQLVTCHLGQTSDEVSCAELEVTADTEEALDAIVDALSSIATQSTADVPFQNLMETKRILVLGAGRMCEPAATYLATKTFEVDGYSREAFVYVGSLFLEDAQKIAEGVPNTKAVQLDVMNNVQLAGFVSKCDVVISLLPPSFHERVASACIELRKNLVTASYVSTGMFAMHERARDAGVTLLCEMGLDPGIDHMMAMKMIDEAHANRARVKSFVSYCGGLPSPEAADNPLGYKFSWNPAGAIKAGRNSATYKVDDEIIEVRGEDLFASAVPFRIPHLPAFALERLPNRDSLMYGDLYGISDEASTIFRATLRYEGFSEIMDALGKIGYYDAKSRPLDATYSSVFEALLQLSKDELDVEKFANIACSKNLARAKRVLKCIRFLGLRSQQEVPGSCKSPFDVLCSQMESKLVFKPDEKDMVLLHHELEVIHQDGKVETHSATLLAFGECSIESSKPQTAMARTVGLTAAIGAELLLTGRIKTTGVVRPLRAEIYLPALEILENLGLHIHTEGEGV